METAQTCPECGAPWTETATCQEYFHQMLYWESETPANGRVHHLMVLCYHLQHPSLYTPEGLAYARGLLVAFLENGLSLAQVRANSRNKVDSGQRSWKIKARPGATGSYEQPVLWKMTAADVVAGGSEAYCENVEAWAWAVLVALKEFNGVSH